MLAHRIGEEIGVGIDQLLVGQLDHPASALRAGLGEEGLGHAYRGLGIDRHGLSENGRIEPGGIIEMKYRGIIDDYAPIFESIGKFADHCNGAIAIA